MFGGLFESWSSWDFPSGRAELSELSPDLNVQPLGRRPALVGDSMPSSMKYGYRLNILWGASGDELNSLLSAELGRAGLPILLRRSLDTRRRRRPSWLLKVALFTRGEQPTPRWQPTNRQAEGPSVVIVGAGPAGSFAALSLLEAGFSPIIIDRGQPVRPRRRSLKALSVDGDLDPESNYCFGEGGAGTFSDGKLYTRSKDRQGVRRLLEMLVAYGAPSRILYDSRPHIGSNQLPRVLTALRTDLEARCPLRMGSPGHGSPPGER